MSLTPGAKAPMILIASRSLSAFFSAVATILTIKGMGITNYTLFANCLICLSIGSIFVEFGQTQQAAKMQIGTSIQEFRGFLIFRTMIASIIFLIYSFYVDQLGISNWVYLVLALSLIFPVISILGAVAYIQRNETFLSQNSSLQGIVYVVSVFLCYLFKLPYYAYIFSFVFASLIQAMHLFSCVWRSVTISKIQNIEIDLSVRKILTLFKTGGPYFIVTLSTLLMYKGTLLVTSLFGDSYYQSVLIISSKLLDVLWIIPGVIVPVIIARYSTALIPKAYFSRSMIITALVSCVGLLVLLKSSPWILNLFDLRSDNFSITVFNSYIVSFVPFLFECVFGAILVSKGHVVTVARSGLIAVISIFAFLAIQWYSQKTIGFSAIMFLIMVQFVRTCFLFHKLKSVDYLSS